MLNMQDRWRVFVGYLAESTGYRNQRTFHVYVPELLPTLTGDITPEETTQVITLENVMTETTENVNVQVATTIVAEYLGVLTSRTVPTMYKNQQVLVLNFSNNDKYYWIPLERDDYLRPFEQIRFSALDQAVTNKSSATGDDIEAKQASITDDNSYFLEIDTKYGKHILLSTSASDGEAWRYFFRIDATTHTVEIWDEAIEDAGRPSNSITLESSPTPEIKGRIRMETAAGASLTLEDKNGMLNIPGNMTVFIGGNLVTNVEGDTASSFQGNVGTTVVGNTVHHNLADAVYNYDSNLGIAVTGTYTLTVQGPIVTDTQTSASHHQPMRTVTTDQVDTLSADTGVRNYTTSFTFTTQTGTETYMTHVLNVTANETITSLMSVMNYTTAKWTIGSSGTVFYLNNAGTYPYTLVSAS